MSNYTRVSLPPQLFCSFRAVCAAASIKRCRELSFFHVLGPCIPKCAWGGKFFKVLSKKWGEPLFLWVMKSRWSSERVKSKRRRAARRGLRREAATQLVTMTGKMDERGGNDKRPEVAGRPRRIAQWAWSMSLRWLHFRASSWNNLPGL